MMEWKSAVRDIRLACCVCYRSGGNRSAAVLEVGVAVVSSIVATVAAAAAVVVVMYSFAG